MATVKAIASEDAQRAIQDLFDHGTCYLSWERGYILLTPTYGLAEHRNTLNSYGPDTFVELLLHPMLDLEFSTVREQTLPIHQNEPIYRPTVRLRNWAALPLKGSDIRQDTYRMCWKFVQEHKSGRGHEELEELDEATIDLYNRFLRILEEHDKESEKESR
jgi:hypothetical protein